LEATGLRSARNIAGRSKVQSVLLGFCKEDLLVVCVECILSNKVKTKTFKGIDEAYEEAYSHYKSEMSQYEEMCRKSQEILAATSRQKEDIEVQRSALCERLEWFTQLCCTTIEEFYEKLKASTESEYQRNADKITGLMKSIKDSLIEASQISEDQYLSKVEFLQKTKSRRDHLLLLRKNLVSFTNKGKYSLSDFNLKNEIENLMNEIRKKCEGDFKAELQDYAKKRPTTGTKLPVKEASKPEAKPDKYAKPNKPSVNLISLADRRNEVKNQKVNPNNGLRVDAKIPRKEQTPEKVNKNTGGRKKMDNAKSTKEVKKGKEQIPKVISNNSDVTGMKIEGRAMAIISEEKNEKNGFDPMSKFHINHLSDQKLSMLSDSTFSIMKDSLDIRRKRNPSKDSSDGLEEEEARPSTPWEKRRNEVKGTDNYILQPNQGFTFQPEYDARLESELINIHINTTQMLKKDFDESSIMRPDDKFLMTESRDRTYDLEKYLETGVMDRTSRSPMREGLPPLPLNFAKNQEKKMLENPYVDHNQYSVDRITPVLPKDKIFSSFLHEAGPPETLVSPDLRENLYCLGGQMTEDKMYIEMMDKSTGEWSVIDSSESQGRYKFGCVMIENGTKILVFGGKAKRWNIIEFEVF
jgi:hypothetical protein